MSAKITAVLIVFCLCFVSCDSVTKSKTAIISVAVKPDGSLKTSFSEDCGLMVQKVGGLGDGLDGIALGNDGGQEYICATVDRKNEVVVAFVRSARPVRISFQFESPDAVSSDLRNEIVIAHDGGAPEREVMMYRTKASGKEK
jgi:hypothetical protein